MINEMTAHIVHSIEVANGMDNWGVTYPMKTYTYDMVMEEGNRILSDIHTINPDVKFRVDTSEDEGYYCAVFFITETPEGYVNPNTQGDW